MAIFMIVMVCLQQAAMTKVVTAQDINIDGNLIKKGSSLDVNDYRQDNWYQLFRDKKATGFVSEQCTEIKNTVLFITRDCPVFAAVDVLNPVRSGIAGKKDSYDFFVFYSRLLTQVVINGNEHWLPVKLLKFEPDENPSAALYELAPIDIIIKLRKENVLLSRAIDKAMYVSTEQGVFVSFNGKKWFRLKKLEKRKYEINVTCRGHLLADNLISRDYGKSFTEFFPSYAFPYKDAFVKNLMVSPHGKDSVYLTFSSYSNPNDMTLFVLNRVEDGWKRIFPTIGDEIFVVPVEDTMTSVLRFVYKWINKAGHPYKGRIDIEDISIQGERSRRTATLLLKVTNHGKVSRFHTILKLSFSGDRGWTSLDEQWRYL
ncbi:MAG: hypothetical protein JXA66_00825 [Oligoflexia bacterium]|nr:hypothetical protein [Oligoflexia bacterium]